MTYNSSFEHRVIPVKLIMLILRHCLHANVAIRGDDIRLNFERRIIRPDLSVFTLHQCLHANVGPRTGFPHPIPEVSLIQGN